MELHRGRNWDPIDPVALLTDEWIEMTDWELHDLAVQIVRDELQKDSKEAHHLTSPAKAYRTLQPGR